MKSNIGRRPLGLEPLEARTLLAGIAIGPFDDLRSMQPRDSLLFEVQSPGHHDTIRSDAQRPSPDRFDRVGPRPTDRSPGGLNPPAFGQPQVTMLVIIWSFQPPSPGAVETSLGAVQSSLGAVDPFVPTQAVANTSTNAPMLVSDTTDSLVAATFIADTRQWYVGSDDLSDGMRLKVADVDPSPPAASRTSAISDSQSVSSNETTDDDVSDASIEVPGFESDINLRSLPMPEPLSISESGPNQCDLLLQEQPRPPASLSTHSLGWSGRPNDSAFAGWSAAGGEWIPIEVDVAQPMTWPVKGPNREVGTTLDRSLGIAKPIELVSPGGGESPGWKIRDAVLAAIAEELTTASVGDDSEPIALRPSLAVYPVAVIATGVYLALRRNRKARLETTAGTGRCHH